MSQVWARLNGTRGVLEWFVYIFVVYQVYLVEESNDSVEQASFRHFIEETHILRNHLKISLFCISLLENGS